MEEEVPMRTTLDQMDLQAGIRLRIYYPNDTAPKVMTTTGRHQDCKSPRAKAEYEFREEGATHTEWIPGWYIASQV